MNGIRFCSVLYFSLSLLLTILVDEISVEMKRENLNWIFDFEICYASREKWEEKKKKDLILWCWFDCMIWHENLFLLCFILCMRFRSPHPPLLSLFCLILSVESVICLFQSPRGFKRRFSFSLWYFFLFLTLTPSIHSFQYSPSSFLLFRSQGMFGIFSLFSLSFHLNWSLNYSFFIFCNKRV